MSFVRRYGLVESGATESALGFAQWVLDGFPADDVMLTELLDSHRGLDMVEFPIGDEPLRFKVSRLLWGGDTAVDWASQALADHDTPTPDPAPAEPVSVAARASGDQRCLDDLADTLFDLDTETIAELRAAFWTAYRTALRQAGVAATARSRKIPLAAQVEAGLGPNDVNNARARMEEAGPFDAWRAMGPIAAVIDADLDRAVESSLNDFEEAAAAILTAASVAAADRIASGLGADRAEVLALAGSADSVVAAAGQLRDELHEWVRTRLNGEREPEDLSALIVPEDALADAVNTAGGAAPDDATDSIGAPLASRVIDRVGRGLLVAGALAAVLVRPKWTWVYGAAARPHGSYLPHLNIAGATWTSEDERIQRIGDHRPRRPHKGCKCRVKQTWEVRI